MHDAMLDVLIVGCGPAGSTAANLLAQAGKSVRVLEREHFPRFHIGESLLPIDLPLFERLGLKVDGSAYHFKQGAEFWDERTGDFAFFSFADAMAGTPPSAWQVERAAFDHMLARQAQERGAQLQFGVTVSDMRADAEGVTVVTDEAGAQAWSTAPASCSTRPARTRGSDAGPAASARSASSVARPCSLTSRACPKRCAPSSSRRATSRCCWSRTAGTG